MKTATKERGSITVFFCFFVLVLVGAISYSLYVGQQVERRINLQNTADAAAIAMANQGSTGLNMMAANNLAIGASIHISGSVAILASYLSVARALTYGLADVGSDLISFGTGGVSKIQSDVWNKLAIVPGIYLRTAAGLTTLNAFLKDYWLFPAPLRSLETTRLNVPGALALPLQKSTMVPGLTAYAGINQSSPRDTFCHTLDASASLDQDQRDSFIRWMQGPLLTLGDSAAVKGVNGLLNLMAKLHEKIARVTGIKIGFVNCGYGLKVKLFDSMNSLAGFITSGNADSFMADAQAIPLTQQAFNDVSLKRKDFGPPCTFLGCPPSPCYEVYSLQHGARYTQIAAEMLTFNHELAKQVALAKMLKALSQDQRGASVSCQPREAAGKESGAAVKNALPTKDHTGAVQCINIATLKWYCPLQDKISMPANFCGGQQHNDKLAEHCQAYQQFKDSEPGIPIADWGEQANTYAQATSTRLSSEVRQKSLGFLMPDRTQLNKFKDSLTFVNAVVNPLRTAEQIKPGAPCPDGMKTIVDSQSFCENTPMIGLSTMFESAARAAMQGKAKHELNLASGGLDSLVNKKSQAASDAISRLDGSLSSTFARAQWTASQAQAYYRPAAKDPQAGEAMQLFWPAWKSRLQPVSVFNELLAIVAKDSRSRPALQTGATMNEVDNP